MLRLLTRFLGLIFLAGGFISLIVDGTRSVAGGSLLVTPFRRALAQWFPGFYAQLQVSIESVSGFFWDPLLLTIMRAPISLTLAALGAGLIVLSHEQTTPTSYPRR